MSDPHPARASHEKEDRRTFLQKVAEFIHPGPDSRDELIETLAEAEDNEIIDAESEVLSDDAIAAMLKQRVFDCARRTVVKYREAMGIGSSIQRRRMRKIAG